MHDKSPEYPTMRRAMALMARIADAHHPGSAFDDAVNWDGDEMWAFGMQTPHGLTRVFANTAGVGPGDTWWMRFSTGVGFEVRDIPAAMRWANDRNGQSVIGTTYVSIAHHGQFCALIWEHLIWSDLIAGLGGPAGEVVTRWMSRVLLEASWAAEDLTPQLRRDLGATPCPPGQQGLTWIRANYL